jgi:hypothetical protein
MMKPDLRWSEKVASWPIPVRYFWTLLWGYVDDHGKGKDNPLLVKADCFPLDEDITAKTIDEWLWLLSESGVVIRYEVDGTRLLAIRNWAEHQKPQHPGKDSFDGPEHPSAILMQPSCSPHEPLTPELSRGGFGFEVESEKGAHHSVGVTFDEFWDVWGRKVSRSEAEKAWAKAVKVADPMVIVLAAQALWESPYRPEKQFIPYPATWLNQRRWEDPPPEPPEDKRGVTPSARAQRTVMLATELLEVES